MGSSRSWQQAVVALVLVMTLFSSSLASIKPAMDLKDFHPIDACLFGCQFCFEDHYEGEREELMLGCANQVCLRALAMGRPLSDYWSRACPSLSYFFQLKWTFVDKQRLKSIAQISPSEAFYPSKIIINNNKNNNLRYTTTRSTIRPPQPQQEAAPLVRMASSHKMPLLVTVVTPVKHPPVHRLQEDRTEDISVASTVTRNKWLWLCFGLSIFHWLIYIIT